MNKSNFVPFHTLDRQWDARFNVPGEDDLKSLLEAIRTEEAAGKFRYALVGGVEIGDRPYADDFGIKHVHVALIYVNRVSKASILKNLKVKQGLGYYLVPRNRTLPFAGWRKHHTKEKTKVNGTTLLFETGSLPEDVVEVSAQVTKRSDEEKKRKLDDVIVEMKDMIERGEEDEAFKKFPRNFLTYGEKIKSMLLQTRDFFATNGDPHIWCYGAPGDGKSALMCVLYPKYYNKNLDNKFFDLFEPTKHTHMLLQDLDHQVVERLGVQFLKTICDESGFPVDKKYKTPQLARTVVLVTSNFPLPEVLPDDMKGRNENLRALMRRFWHVRVGDLLRALGLKLLSKYELACLKKEGNVDPRKLFLSWDYLRDTPTGEPLGTAEFYQAKVRELYYGKPKEK